METKIFCPFWPICGPAPILQRLARQIPGGEDYIIVVCNNESGHVECKYYQVWIKLEAEKVAGSS